MTSTSSPKHRLTNPGPTPPNPQATTHQPTAAFLPTTAFLPTAPQPTAATGHSPVRSATRRPTEFTARMEQANSNADGVFASMSDVTLDESRAVDDGFEVNGTISFTITSLLGNLPETLLLTCHATVAHGKLVTTVTNRA